MNKKDYWVTLFSHFTIANITPIEIRQTMRNTVQHIQIGHLLYISEGRDEELGHSQEEIGKYENPRSGLESGLH